MTEYAALIAALDLRDKVNLLTGASAFTLAPCEAIGLAEVRLSDGPTGVRGLKFHHGRTVALFPNATLLASAWSEDSAYEVGRLLKSLVDDGIVTIDAERPKAAIAAEVDLTAPDDDDLGAGDPTDTPAPGDDGEAVGSKPSRPLLRIGSKLGRQGPKG